MADEIRTRRWTVRRIARADGGRDKQLQLELIRVVHETNHRLLIVGVATDVGQHGQAGTFGGDRCH